MDEIGPQCQVFLPRLLEVNAHVPMHRASCCCPLMPQIHPISDSPIVTMASSNSGAVIVAVETAFDKYDRDGSGHIDKCASSRVLHQTCGWGATL